jgi:endoglucanase
MRNLGYGTISVTGVPPGATVESATLMWDLVADQPDPTFAQGTFAGTPITGTQWASGASPCWSPSSNFSYEADVTSLVSGNGSYQLANFATGQSDGADPWNVGSTPPLLEGATLIVVYSLPSMPRTTIQIAAGAAETQGGSAVTATLSGFAAGSEPSATTTYIVADGQIGDSTATVDGATVPGDTFPGGDPQAVANYSHSNLWDTTTNDVGPLLKGGDTSATLSVTENGDCLVWVGQVLSVATGPSLTLTQSPSSTSTAPTVMADSSGWNPGQAVHLYVDSEFGATWVASATADAGGDAAFGNVPLPRWLMTNSTRHLSNCSGAYELSNSPLTGCGYVLTAMGNAGGRVGEAGAGFMLDTGASGDPIYFPSSHGSGVTTGGSFTDPGCGSSGPAGATPPAPALPLRAWSRWVLDRKAHRFKFDTVNWYGAEEADFVPGGLDCRSVASIASTIAALGFNSVRLPWSNAMLELNPSVCRAINPDTSSPWKHDGEECIPPEAIAGSPSLRGDSAIQIYRHVIDALAADNVVVILDNHSTDASFTPSPYEGLWWGGKLWDDRGNGSSTAPNWRARTTYWESDWTRLLQLLKSDPHYPFIVGADLRNEPAPAPAYGQSVKALWPTRKNSPPQLDRSTCTATPSQDGTRTNWVEAAEAGGDSVLCADPSLLVTVEGINYAGDLSGVLQYSNGNPVVTKPILIRPNNVSHLVYSVHDYCFGCSSSYADMTTQLGKDWGFLLTQGQAYTAPVWVGEFGANQSQIPAFSTVTADSTCSDGGSWFNCFVNYLAGNDADWSDWAVNGTEADAGIHSPTDPRGLTADESYGILDPAWRAARSDSAIHDLQAVIGPATQVP